MSEELKAKARRAYEEVWSDWKPEVFDEVYAADFLYHDPEEPNVHSLAEYREWASGAHTSFPDLHLTVEDMLAEGDQVAARGKISGSQEGEGFTEQWISIFRFAGGKVIELWNVHNQEE
jgi:predicted ester cyclase